jgi:hypothetical protein
MLGFTRADLARRQGSRSENEDMDGQVPAPGPSGHPFGMYFQARARQAGRPQGECVELLLKAAQFFEADLEGIKEPNLLSFLATCVRLRAAAALADKATWRLLRKELGRYLRGRPHQGLARHYRHAWEALDDAPDVAAAEALLARVPYF